MKIKYLLIIPVLLVIPLLVIKFLYPNIGINYVKFSEEYLKILGGSTIGLIMGLSSNFISKMIDIRAKNFERKKLLDIKLDEYISILDQFLITENVSSEKEFSKYYTAIKDKLNLVEKELKQIIQDQLISYYKKKRTPDSQLRNLLNLINTSTHPQVMELKTLMNSYIKINNDAKTLKISLNEKN